MPEHLTSTATLDDHEEQDALRLLARSPHPYHRQHFELLEPSDRIVYSSARALLNKPVDEPPERPPPPAFTRDSTPNSDSGTEADDEHFLRGLPAPRARLHKGVRGRNEPLSGTSTPLPSPAFPDDEDKLGHFLVKKESTGKLERRKDSDRSLKFRKEVIRRLSECLLLAGLAAIVHSNPQAQPIWHAWKLELCLPIIISAGLLTLYPLRLTVWAYRHRRPASRLPLYIPSSFDPAPILYPPAITLLVASLIATDNEAVLLPNVILAVSSIPRALVPTLSAAEQCDPLHWILACTPILIRESDLSVRGLDMSQDGTNGKAWVSPESAVLLYPLHQYLSMTLQILTTTSLLPAELELLSVALINTLLLSSSPQAIILQGVLWLGGLGVMSLCGQVIVWGIALARVPKWRFARVTGPRQRSSGWLSRFNPWKKVKRDALHHPRDDSSSSAEVPDGTYDSDEPLIKSFDGPARVQSIHVDRAYLNEHGVSAPIFDYNSMEDSVAATDGHATVVSVRRHTLPSLASPIKRSSTHTPSGRRKRAASVSVRAFFTLTPEQATTRRWLYSSWVYATIVSVIFAPKVGIRSFVANHALNGHDPVGWALGYMFGEIPWFRWKVVLHNLGGWVCLPPRLETGRPESYRLSSVQDLRHNFFGEATTRLILSAYWLGVMILGLVVVFRLSPIYEVDTRRKVFHFMMVAMFLPATYIDPTFAALALSLVLAIFLLLDLLRASQLPPLSKPLAAFLAPYVDGRDLRGPVVISHIFLLIGCAIPLWLSLGSVSRTGSGYLEGWEVPTREVSMVAGVVCVGLGDAAASLIGRRYGNHKWYWSGGKSLEGSVAFAIAVFVGLIVANVWLRIGGWATVLAQPDALTTIITKTGICASMASLTEAVLTGGNDNVVVPVVLWTCVKSLDV